LISENAGCRLPAIRGTLQEKRIKHRIQTVMKTSTPTLIAAAMLLGVSAPIASVQTTAPETKEFDGGGVLLEE
jgi:hypothetical protein